MQGPGLNSLLRELQDLLDSALSELSQHIDEIRWKTPSSVSPAKSPGPPPGLQSMPQSTEMAQALLWATTNLGQLPSGERPVMQAPGYEEMKRATDIIEAQLKAPGMPLQKWTDILMDKTTQTLMDYVMPDYYNRISRLLGLNIFMPIFQCR